MNWLADTDQLAPQADRAQRRESLYQFRDSRSDLSPTKTVTRERTDVPPKLDDDSKSGRNPPRQAGREPKVDRLDAPVGAAESVSVPKGSAATDERVKASYASFAPGLSRGRVAVSAARLSVALTGLYPGASAWSVTLTTRSNTLRELMERGRAYAATIAKMYPAAIGILALDRGPTTGHPHLHGLVISATAYETALIRAWLNLWPAARGSGRPLPSLQRARGPLTSGRGRTRVISKILAHALDRHAELEAKALGNVTFRLPMVRERIIYIGDSMRKVLDGALRAHPKPTKPHDQRRETWSPGERCCWCAGPLQQPIQKQVRPDARFHKNCARVARRALKVFLRETQPLVGQWLSVLVRRQAGLEEPKRRRDFNLDRFLNHPATDRGWHVRTWLTLLENGGWLRLDALRAISTAIAQTEWPTLHPLLNPRLAGVLFCECGQQLKRKTNATTCGKARCRAARQRKVGRGSPQRGGQAPTAAGTESARRGTGQQSRPTTSPAMPPPSPSRVFSIETSLSGGLGQRREWPAAQRREVMTEGSRRWFCACEQPLPQRDAEGTSVCVNCWEELPPEAQPHRGVA